MISGVTRSGYLHYPGLLSLWAKCKVVAGIGLHESQERGTKTSAYDGRLAQTKGYKFNARLWVLDFHFGLVLVGLCERLKNVPLTLAACS